MANRFKELGCQRCKNRLVNVKSRQGQYCAEMIQGENTTCQRFKLDHHVN